MSEPLLIRSHVESVLRLTLNRPAVLNAFDVELTAALLAALEDARADHTVRAVLLEGAGRGFSSGQDLAEFVSLAAAGTTVAEHLRHGYNRVVLALRSLEKPVIAALGGIAAGVGLSLALACDLRVAADDARLTLGFSRIGLIPDGGASLLLPVLVGLPRALELAWSSERIDAPTALRYGLVNAVVPAASFRDDALQYAARFAAISPVAAALTKRAFNEACLPHLAAWLEREAALQGEAAAAPDLAEGLRAFHEKRAPLFETA